MLVISLSWSGNNPDLHHIAFPVLEDWSICQPPAPPDRRSPSAGHQRMLAADSVSCASDNGSARITRCDLFGVLHLQRRCLAFAARCSARSCVLHSTDLVLRGRARWI